MAEPDYENDLVFPPQEKQTPKMNFISSRIKPDEPMYIISDENHIGWHHNGKVYYFVYAQGKTPEPESAFLENWCDYWMPLVEVCRAAQGKFEDCLLATTY